MKNISIRVALSFIGAVAGVCTLLMLLITAGAVPLSWCLQRLSAAHTRLEATKNRHS